MNNLLLSILFSTLTVSLFKVFDIKKVDTFQAIVVNYLTCCLVGSMIADQPVLLGPAWNAEWLPLTLILGTLFICIFWFIAKTAQQVGISVSMVAAKLSVVIPVMIAVVLYDEPMGFLKVLGIVCSLVAVLLVSKPDEPIRKVGFALLGFPALVFLGSGIIDALLNFLGRKYIPPYQVSDLVTTAFFFAFVLGFLFWMIQLIRGRKKVTLKSVIWGIILGVPNYFSIYFLLKTLEGFDATFIFPINNIGIVALTALVSVLIFRDTLSIYKWYGIGLALISILLIGYS